MRLDHLDYMAICRDEACDRRELHGPHPVHGKNTGSVFTIPRRRLLVDLTFEVVSLRVPKTFAQVYTDVVDEYGSITERNVRVALRELRDAREIALVIPAGAQNVVHTDGVGGAYIRYDSPLLWQVDGLHSLMDVVHDLVGERFVGQRAYA